MQRIIDIPLPLAHVGSVNAWLLLGEPLTLIDTGPRDDGALADYAEDYAAEVEEDRSFAHALMAHHGVPPQVVAHDEPFWDFIRAGSEGFRADVRLADGDRIRAGGRVLRVLARP